MTAPLVIQNSPLTAATTNTTVLTLTGVTAGNTLVLLLAIGNTVGRTYTVSDDKGNTWTTIGSVTGRAVRIAYATNVAGGTTQITLSQSSTFVAYTLIAIEIEASTFVDDSVYTDTSGSFTTHYSATSDELDVSSDGIILAIGLHNASGGTLTKGVSHTLLGTPTSTVLAQYIRSDAGFVNERSSWTSSTARNTFGASIAFQGVASGITATLTITEDNDTVSSVSVIAISATSGITEDNDTLSSVSALAITASLSITEQDDTCVGASLIGGGPIGTVGATEQDDTLVSTATVALNASAGITEANDTLSSSSTLLLRAVLSVTEANDTLFSAATISDVGAAIAIDGSPYAPWYIQNTEAW